MYMIAEVGGKFGLSMALTLSATRPKAFVCPNCLPGNACAEYIDSPLQNCISNLPLIIPFIRLIVCAAVYCDLTL